MQAAQVVSAVHALLSVAQPPKVSAVVMQVSQVIGPGEQSW